MNRRGFTLTELLVAIAIMLVLMTLAGSAYSNARLSVKVSATRTLIAQLDAILTQQLESYGSQSIPLTDADAAKLREQAITNAAYRAWYLRRNIVNGDMPDRWSDVKIIAGDPATFTTAAQKTYRAIWNSLPAHQKLFPDDSGYNSSAVPPPVAAEHSGAECLFMVTMRGGIADCLSCGPLRNASIGDKDGDGMPEFWDAWGNPIDFILWPAGIILPPQSGAAFFSGRRATDNPFGTGRIRPTLGLRPLIYSAGPDGAYCLDRVQRAGSTDAPMLVIPTSGSIGFFPNARDCGNPLTTPVSSLGTLAPIDRNGQSYDGTPDNITNLDAEAKQ